jgi:signal transduction histidine kinase
MTIESFFKPPHPPTTEKEQHSAVLMVRFTLISIGFALAYWLFSFVTGYLFVRYQMLVVSALFGIQLMAFKMGWIGTRQASHFFVFTSWLVIISLTLASNGIRSYVLPWGSLVPVIALVLLSKRAAIRWSITCAVTVLIFLFANPDRWVPAYLVLASVEPWIASLNLGLLFIMLTLVYIFYQQQLVLISTIENRNEALRLSKHELERVQHIIQEQRSQLQVKNQDLEVEIDKRTHELVRYNQQLEQFTFIASHNLRSPIARILGLATLLGMPGEDHDDIRNRLVSATKDLDQVVKDLNVILNIRKNSDLVHTELHLPTEVASIITALEKDIVESGASIEIELNEINTIKSVRPYLHSIIMNLLGNAIKYQKPGQPPNIKLSVEKRPGTLVLSVADAGVGIDIKAAGAKLFTLYSRFHTHVHGRGLGLYLVKSQVEALGGNIRVESVPNQGSTFYVYFKQP